VETFDFSTKVNSEIKSLAESRGDTLIGAATGDYQPGRSCDYRHFKLSCGHCHDIRVAHYRSKAYTCPTCFIDNINSVAASQGLKLVSMDVVKHCNDRMYVRECGHTEVFSHQYLKKHKITACQKCAMIDATNNAVKNNFTLLNKTRIGYLLKCNKCGTVADFQAPTTRKGNLVCDCCFDEQLKVDAVSAGFSYLVDREPKRVVSKSRTTLLRWYSCNECGYVDTFGHVPMRMKNVRCKACYSKQLSDEAARQGMTHLGHVSGVYHKYKLPCGCEREFPPFSVRKGVWACKVHDNTHYHRPSGIYLIRVDHPELSWLKFGYAKDVDIRLRGYGLTDGCESEILFHIPFETGYQAMEIEKSIHTILSGKRLDPTSMKRFMTNTGHTECYPLEIQDEIISRMEPYFE